MTAALVMIWCAALGSVVRAQQPVSNVDVLLGTHAVLHLADMLTTSYDLTRGPSVGAREANPLLSMVGSRPISIVTASSVISTAQAVMIKRLEPRHRVLATVWAAGLVAVEVWATINNINRAGEIQRQLLAR
jgi:hypothetical protein